MHEREKSDPAIGAGKPTAKAEATSVADVAEPWSKGGGRRKRERTKHAPDKAGSACHRRSSAYGRPLRRHHPRWEPYALIGLVQNCAGAQGNLRAYRDPDGTAAVQRTGGQCQLQTFGGVNHYGQREVLNLAP